MRGFHGHDPRLPCWAVSWRACARYCGALRRPRDIRAVVYRPLAVNDQVSLTTLTFTDLRQFLNFSKTHTTQKTPTIRNHPLTEIPIRPALPCSLARTRLRRPPASSPAPPRTVRTTPLLLRTPQATANAGASRLAGRPPRPCVLPACRPDGGMKRESTYRAVRLLGSISVNSAGAGTPLWIRRPRRWRSCRSPGRCVNRARRRSGEQISVSPMGFVAVHPDKGRYPAVASGITSARTVLDICRPNDAVIQ
jgi:hypothetical protein